MIDEKVAKIMDKIEVGRRGWTADLCLHYWASYEGLVYKKLRDKPLTSPQTIIYAARKHRKWKNEPSQHVEILEYQNIWRRWVEHVEKRKVCHNSY